ncbi:MAG: hypothetical protein JNL14_14420 [Devosia sp.]|uniref:hypothetical protein n=1 Tax=Devosia sp. TaxID=1871048 RepID=UPI001A380FC3|nr:hypothetical protein [Devosia sp.]MBL8598926.1 hypothetical protein [Devosia sp.]
MRFLAALSIAIGAATYSGTAVAACTVPSYNTFYGTPDGYSAADAFVGKFDYPAAPTEPLPAFMAIDFTSDWKAYLQGALDYAFEGNEAVEFDVAQNTAREWYHALWMHPDASGREFLRGLTQERASRPDQYKDGLAKEFQTWAIGFYNSFGAAEFHEVWANPCDPDVSALLFPVGTVTFKLLFTEATSADLPYLANAPSWMAHIGRSDPVVDGVQPVRVRPMQLLQVDIAVRDDDAAETGWVFGTFVYSNDVASADPWRKLKPVGLSWGNDPTVLPGNPLSENVTDMALAGTLFGWPERLELGWGGRMNGPADNLLSSCTSCHGTAQFPRSDDFSNFPRLPVAPADYPQRLLDYFRNIEPGVAFDPMTKFRNSTVEVPAFPLDYSLQVQSGLERICNAARRMDPPFDTEPVPAVCVEANYLVTPMMAAPITDEVLKRQELNKVDWDQYEPPIR